LATISAFVIIDLFVFVYRLKDCKYKNLNDNSFSITFLYLFAFLGHYYI